MPARSLFSLAGLTALVLPSTAAADWPEIVERAAGSVVGIEVTPADVRPAALHRFGAGVVFDPGGHVVTTAALLEGAQTVQVRLDDGRRADARVVGADPVFGVAVLELAAHPPAFPLGRSDLARLGEAVGALTRADDGRVVFREGVLSARGGGGGGTLVLDDDLHVDFDLDATFAGAPLLDAAGHVLGLFTGRAPSSPPPRRRPRVVPAPHLSAVPVEVLAEAVRQIVDSGHVDWPWLGLDLAPTPTDTSGAAARVQVLGVSPGSPAAAAGLWAGDVVVTVDGRRVRRVADVQRAVLAKRVGQHVAVVVERAGQTRPLDVVPRARPSRD